MRKVCCCLSTSSVNAWDCCTGITKQRAIGPTLDKILLHTEFSLSFSCRDKEKADRAQETVFRVDELTQKFQDAVLIVQEKVRADASTVEASLHFMSCVEKMVLLQREWSTKVYSVLYLVSSECKLLNHQPSSFPVFVGPRWDLGPIIQMQTSKAWTKTVKGVPICNTSRWRQGLKTLDQLEDTEYVRLW